MIVEMSIHQLVHKFVSTDPRQSYKLKYVDMLIHVDRPLDNCVTLTFDLLISRPMHAERLSCIVYVYRVRY